MPKTCRRKETWSFNPSHGTNKKVKNNQCDSETVPVVSDPGKILVKPVEFTKLVFCCDISAEKVIDMPPELRKRHKKVVELSSDKNANVKAGNANTRNSVAKDGVSQMKQKAKKSSFKESKLSKESESGATKDLNVSYSMETKYDIIKLIKNNPRITTLPKPETQSQPQKKSRLSLKSRCKGKGATLEKVSSKTLVDIKVPSDSITSDSQTEITLDAIKVKKEVKVEVKDLKLCNVGITNINSNSSQNLKKEFQDSEDSDLDDVFVRCKNELNFVLAKSITKRKVGFKIDEKTRNLTKFSRKMRKLLQQADLMKLKSVLDSGGKTGRSLSIPKQFSYITEDTNNNEEIPLDTPFGSTQTSPDVSVTEFSHINADVDHMPILQLGSVKEDNDYVDEASTITPPKKKSKTVLDLVEERFYSSQVAIKPENLDMLPQMKKISFKIPKKTSSKACIKSWQKNAELWRWALTVDANCQFSRSKNGCKQRVPWSLHLDSRNCDEFELWLKRRAEGDEMDWRLTKVEVEMDIITVCEKASRRQDVEWKEKAVDRMMQVVPDMKKARTLEEIAVFTDFNDDFDIDSESSESIIDDDISDLESVSSQQSMVTHIRTPPHIFVIDDVQLDVDNSQQMETSSESVSQNCPLSPPLSLPADRLDGKANLSPSLCGEELNQDDRMRPDITDVEGVSGDNKLTSLMSALVKSKHARLRL